MRCSVLLAILLTVTFVGPAGCSRKDADSGTGAAVDPGDVAPDAGDELAAIESVGVQRSGDDIRMVDLTKVSGTELRKAIAATVALPKVQEVRLAGESVDDPAALPIAGIPTLRRLRLTDTAITDTVLEKLADRGTLQLLHVHGGESITEAGWSRLSDLPELKELSLSGSNVKDAVLVPIAELPKLRKLRLRGSAIDGQAFAPIANTSIEDLELAETDFSNAGMEHVATMPALTKLNLWLTKVDDDGVAALRGKDQLTSLNLDHLPGVTDDSIDAITTLPKLTFLHLGKTSVTGQGIAKLAPLQNLETLHVTNLGVDDEVITDLKSEIPALQNVVN